MNKILIGIILLIGIITLSGCGNLIPITPPTHRECARDWEPPEDKLISQKMPDISTENFLCPEPFKNVKPKVIECFSDSMGSGVVGGWASRYIYECGDGKIYYVLDAADHFGAETAKSITCWTQPTISDLNYMDHSVKQAKRNAKQTRTARENQSSAWKWNARNTEYIVITATVFAIAPSLKPRTLKCMSGA